MSSGCHIEHFRTIMSSRYTPCFDAGDDVICPRPEVRAESSEGTVGLC